MRTWISVLCAMGAVSLASAAPPPPSPRQTADASPLLLRFARAWDGTRMIDNARILVQGDRIVAVSAAARGPAGTREIDLRPLTAIPGLIDVHTHMTYAWDGAAGTTPLNQPRRDAGERAA